MDIGFHVLFLIIVLIYCKKKQQCIDSPKENHFLPNLKHKIAFNSDGSVRHVFLPSVTFLFEIQKNMYELNLLFDFLSSKSWGYACCLKYIKRIWLVLQSDKSKDEYFWSKITSRVNSVRHAPFLYLICS